MKTKYDLLKKDFKDFGNETPKDRHSRIFQDGIGERLHGDSLEKFEKENLVECLITYKEKKGVKEQVVAYLTARGVKEDDILSIGTNQILLRGEQSKMQYISGAMDVNAPDLIIDPVIPYLTNSGDYGKVKLSPKGVQFNKVLDRTADLVNETFEQRDGNVTPESFARMIDDKKRNMNTSGYGDYLRFAMREVSVVEAIAANVHDAIESRQKLQEIGPIAKGKSFLKHLVKGETSNDR